MSSNFLLTFFELITIALSITVVVLGINELYSKRKKAISLIKKSILLVSGLIVISSIGIWHFSNKLSDEKENEFNNKMLIAEESIALNKATTAAAILKSDSLKNELQKTELELEKLKSSVRDRFIPSGKIPLVKNLLTKHTGKTISFICLGSDIEAVNFVSQLASLFKSYNWSVHSHGVVLFGQAQPPGLRIFLKDELFAERARDVQSILEKLGYKSELYLNPKLDRELQIIVGAKERNQIKLND